MGVRKKIEELEEKLNKLDGETRTLYRIIRYGIGDEPNFHIFKQMDYANGEDCWCVRLYINKNEYQIPLLELDTAEFIKKSLCSLKVEDGLAYFTVKNFIYQKTTDVFTIDYIKNTYVHKTMVVQEEEK